MSEHGPGICPLTLKTHVLCLLFSHFVYSSQKKNHNTAGYVILSQTNAVYLYFAYHSYLELSN